MGYLLIKKDDAKTFKSFLSGNEIEVGIRVDSQVNIFHPDEEIYVFYGNDDDGTYKARVTRQQPASENTSLLLLGLVKDNNRSVN